MSRGSLRRWLVVAFLVVQLVVPIVVLTAPRPSRFGWQMFTAYAPLPTVWAEDPAGERAAVDVERLLVHPRPEANLSQPIAEAVCRTDDVVAVVVESATADPERVPCS